MFGSLTGVSTGAAYLILFSFVLTESGIPAGLLLPGDSLLFGAGLLSANPNSGVSFWPVITLVTLGGTLGDTIGYEIGRRAGRPWLMNREGRLGSHHVDRAEAFTKRFGWAALVLARFAPWVRSFVPIIAGIGRMRYVVFVLANLLGAFAWAMSVVGLGYYAYHVPWLRNVAFALTGVGIALAVVVIIVQLVGRARRKRRGQVQSRDRL
jgi:membrane-associated protein